jgi:hypothetical protein
LFQRRQAEESTLDRPAFALLPRYDMIRDRATSSYMKMLWLC